MIPWILASLRSIGARTWMLILTAAGVALAFFSAHRSGKRAGRQEVEKEQLERTVENAETRNDVDNDVAREPSPVDRLRDRWSRDKRVRVDATDPRR